MVPKDAAALDHPDLHVRNVLVRGVGHMSLPVDGRVVHEIGTALAHLGADGSTLTAGVTTLTAGRGTTTQGKQRRAHTG
jgi:hypothetical protein